MELPVILSVINLILLAGILVKIFGLSGERSRMESLVREETARNREELSRSLKDANDSLSRQIFDLTKLNENKLEKVREAVETNLRALQEDNGRRLEQMRQTVDEKLQSTLEKRLGESFRMVSERLERVHEGLGEMQGLATGVGDLKKVLTNVKARGILGEIALENLLEQILSPGQYAKNVVTKQGSKDPVEFVIKLPDSVLPIDAKFPLEDYQRLQEAVEEGDAARIQEAGKAIETRIKNEAKKIREKYIDPPHTTDFGILYLPVEGLYAEVLRRPGLFETVQREYRITLAGPTTIATILNSLQMGFRTLAVQQRASEVWALLGKVKAEFGNFGLFLEKTHKKLQEASNTIEQAASKSRNIESKLKNVQQLPSAEQQDTIEHDSPVSAS